MSESAPAPHEPVPMEAAPHPAPDANAVVMMSSKKFVAGCLIVAALILLACSTNPIPRWVLALEIFSTVIGLFVFGSFKYQIHKNALTFGMSLVIVASFFTIWWPECALKQKIAAQGFGALVPFIHTHLLTFAGLDELFHADTMLFILGLTYFVCVIAQTRILESVTLALLRKSNGSVLPTVLAVTAVVAFSSGILDGVSMIGLTIRTLAIVLLLAGYASREMSFAVMLCTVVTTVCGMWLAYGEPPNLIMKSNLIGADGESYLPNSFFLYYCLPAAVISFGVIAWNLWRRLAGKRVNLDEMDVLDVHAPTVRFLQAQRHGDVLSAVEVAEDHIADFGSAGEPLLARLHKGETFGIAMVRENIPPGIRQKILGIYISEDLALSLDRHYVLDAAGDHAGALAAEKDVDDAIAALSPRRQRAQQAGALGLVVFIICLICHGLFHAMPLFVAPLLGFVVSMMGIFKLPKVRALAIHEARVEFAEYYFLLPLFLSLFLLTKVGFFDQLQQSIISGIHSAGRSNMAFAQFFGCTLLSAILDNNIVADFGSRALHGLELGTLHLFAMAQIAGYAAGGCWTHIGCAQSVVAFSFVRRDIDPNFTPMNWIREMTPVMIQLIVVLTAYIYLQSWLH